MTNTRFRAITTRYKGFAFRSRLEARWACFFDYLNIRWDYEPEGFELGNGLRYLPDFWLPDWDMWVEIKPDAPDPVSLEKAARLAVNSHKSVFVTNGMPLSGGTVFLTTPGRPMIQCPCEVDWAALDRRCAWLFTDEIKENTALFAWGGLEFFVRRASDSERIDWYSPPAHLARDAARSARFEFGARGNA